MIPIVYVEYRPPPGLSAAVECLWWRDGSRAEGTAAPILPDGRVDLVWTADGEMLVAGPQTRSLARPLRAPFVAVGARFRPGAAPRVLGLPAHELVDEHVPLDALDTAAAAALVRRLSAFENREEGLRRQVGYGPKTLQRILRFQRLLHALERGRDEAGGLAAIAAELGYADHAHLTRETRALAGVSPVELERRWTGGDGAPGGGGAPAARRAAVTSRARPTSLATTADPADPEAAGCRPIPAALGFVTEGGRRSDA